MSGPADEIGQVLDDFSIPLPADGVDPFGAGNINAAYLVPADGGDWILQQINRAVFTDLECLESNMRAVSAHLSRAGADGSYRPGHDLEYRSSRSERLIVVRDGRAWRVMRRVPDAYSRPTVDSDDDAFRAADAFGHYDAILSTLAPGALCDPLPGFHDTPARIEALAAARERADAIGLAHRIRRAASEIAFCTERAEALCRRYRATIGSAGAGSARSLVCHNDAKVDNLLLDNTTGQPVCVIDRDTTGPGHPFVDLGDLLRTAASSVSEDEPDPSAVHVVPSRADAIVDGFVGRVGGLLSAEERADARSAGWIITMEQAIRFLTDYLAGDTYYRTHYPEHNYDRAANQCALAASMEAWDPGLSLA